MLKLVKPEAKEVEKKNIQINKEKNDYKNDKKPRKSYNVTST